MSRIIIVGGGLAGGLAALALARRRPELDLFLVEQGSAFGGNHTWSFFDTDIDTTSRWVLDPIERIHWPDHAIRFPRRSRTIPIGYNSIRSAGFDAAIKAALKPEQYRLGEAIDVLGPTDIKLSRGERIEADSVIDARGPGAVPGLDLGWQKFVGRVYRFSRPHGVPRPVIMDGTVTQHDGYRFLYFLPLSGTDLLIEDTYYSTDPSLDRATLCGRLGESAAVIDASEASILDEESGVLPVVMGGDFETLWPGHDPIPRLGLRGGFFHPTTSYSLPDAVGNAAWLAAQSDLSVGALAAGLRQRAKQAWRARGFYRLLNRMLFRAAAPSESYRVLEHFYRLPPATIARFYGGRMTPFDKARILSGKPPVPLTRALKVMFGKAA